MLDPVQQPVAKHVQLQGCMGQRTSSFPEWKGACDAIREVRNQCKIYSLCQLQTKTNESTDPSGTLVGLVYMQHEQVRPS